MKENHLSVMSLEEYEPNAGECSIREDIFPFILLFLSRGSWDSHSSSDIRKYPKMESLC